MGGRNTSGDVLHRSSMLHGANTRSMMVNYACAYNRTAHGLQKQDIDLRACAHKYVIT